MVDLVNLQEDGHDDVMADQLKVGIADQVRNVVLAACEEVVKADDLVAC